MGEDNDTENTLTGEIALTADNYTTIKLEYKNNPEIASMMLDKEKFLLIATEYLNVKEYMFW